METLFPYTKCVWKFSSWYQEDQQTKKKKKERESFLTSHDGL